MKTLFKCLLTAPFLALSLQAQENEVSTTPEAEKENFLKILKTEIEPNLMKKDVRTLNRNVMRLGSYRGEWSSKGKEFLVANAPLAELYLYSYTQVGNLRLNERIIHTLLEFKQFRYPKAPWAFFSSMKATPEIKSKGIQLFSKVLSQNESLWPLYRDLVFGEWGSDLDTPTKLNFALEACRAGLAVNAENQTLFQELLSEVRGFWSNFVSRELKACLRGV